MCMYSYLVGKVSIFSLSLRVFPYFVYASSKGSGKTAVVPKYQVLPVLYFLIPFLADNCCKKFKPRLGQIARRLRAKFWPDCAIPDTSMKFGTVVDHD